MAGKITNDVAGETPYPSKAGRSALQGDKEYGNAYGDGVWIVMLYPFPCTVLTIFAAGPNFFLRAAI
jgi:hypothetical protein